MSPSHIRNGGREGALNCILFGLSSKQSPGHTCTRVLGICSLLALEEVGKLRLEQALADLRINTREVRKVGRQGHKLHLYDR